MTSESYQYRLITRSDFDGLVCAILLKEMNLLGEIKFVHPKQVQDGEIEITERDILTNVPYNPNCHLCFDHHDSEELRVGEVARTNHIIDTGSRSAASVVYNYYGGAEAFPNVSTEMLEAVDKADSAQFTRQEILAPTGWTLLNFIMDPRTGLGRFRNYRISNYDLMMALIDLCRNYSVDKVLAFPDVQERIEVYNSQRELFCEQIARCATPYNNVVVLDLRHEDAIFCGNRFMIYALYPECDVSVHIMPGRGNQNTVIAMGKSILCRTNTSRLGDIALRYGGGGHDAAATCQVAHEDAEVVLDVIITELQSEPVAVA